MHACRLREREDEGADGEAEGVRGQSGRDSGAGRLGSRVCSSGYGEAHAFEIAQLYVSTALSASYTLFVINVDRSTTLVDSTSLL